MSNWAPKRFWKEVCVVEVEGGYSIQLDGRFVKTPAKAALVVARKELAALLAKEWDAQVDTLRPETMPFTRAVNVAIDRLPITRAEVIAHLTEYAGNDLLCYRAEKPQELVARQAAAWDPLLEWAQSTYGARFVLQSGIMPVDQDEATVAALGGALNALSHIGLAAAHELITISGSFVLALAVMAGRVSAEEAWDLARVDEEWQIEEWGADEEAAEQAALKRAAFLEAATLYLLSN